jgi:ATP-dependent HslUV protease ATP-binding subunit HslU
MEKILEEISFEAPDTENKTVIINSEYVEKVLTGIIENQDLSKYVL